jgi:hypothetical protein
MTIIFCVVLSICVLVAIGYFVGNLVCNKESKSVAPTNSLKEENNWTSDNFEKLKYKIKLENAEIFTNEFSISPNIPDLLDCVTHTFTLKYNDPKLIGDSNFDSRVKQLITDCKESMKKTKEDPERYPDSDPGPPVWSPSVIKKFKGMLERMLTIESYEPTSSRINPKSPNSDQLDCIIDKLKRKFENPRDMIKLFRTNEKETKELIFRITGECNYNLVPQGSKIQWDEDSILMLKFRIIINDASTTDVPILYTKGLISCVTEDIMSKITNLDNITTPLLEESKKECRKSDLRKFINYWPDETSRNSLKDYIRTQFRYMTGGIIKDNIENELNCIVNKFKDIFKTPQEYEKLTKLIGKNDLKDFNQLIIINCLSLWTPDDDKVYIQLIKDKLMKFGITYNEESLPYCILNFIKEMYVNPKKIPKDTDGSIMISVIKDMYKTCTGKDLQEPQSNNFDGVPDAEIENLILLTIPSLTSKYVSCILDKIKTSYLTPSDETISRTLIIKKLYNDCIQKDINQHINDMIIAEKPTAGNAGGISHEDIKCISIKIEELYPNISDFKEETRATVIRQIYEECRDTPK